MADAFTKELKHMNMQHIRSKDTKAEAVLRKNSLAEIHDEILYLETESE